MGVAQGSILAPLPIILCTTRAWFTDAQPAETVRAAADSERAPASFQNSPTHICFPSACRQKICVLTASALDPPPPQPSTPPPLLKL
ncbi:hypothetical protein SKAU_G00394790 [Synaphobranchus kaupii]|uniref:Uncharacterized protein n=1 Tax=Synaphobranchus kaupii TaxID=118154 RepID=A0A9Q1IDZ7_SYNKA|nr:hypothetical protein SKAU_G00394790 [Synaphobranchus kaupii]